MRPVPYSRYYLPNRIKGRKPYPSTYTMTEEQAKELGALGVVPGSTVVRMVPESPSENEVQSAGRDGARGKPKE